MWILLLYSMSGVLHYVDVIQAYQVAVTKGLVLKNVVLAGSVSNIPVAPNSLSNV
jgi:hypothetical protein